MRHAHVTLTKAQEALQSLHEDRNMVLLVRRMATEIVRLDEENAQLLASIKVYRELVAKYDARHRRNSVRSIELPIAG